MPTQLFFPHHAEQHRTANILVTPNYLDLPDEIWHGIVACVNEKQTVALACRRARWLHRATVTVLKLPALSEVGAGLLLTNRFPSLHTLKVSTCSDGSVWSASQLIKLLKADTALGHRLRHLHLIRCSGLNDGTLSMLASAVPNLRTLDISTQLEGTGVSSLAAIGGLKHLTKINLVRVKLIQSEALAPLANLRDLKRMSLTCCTLSAAALDSLPVLPGLTSLEFMDCDVHRPLQRSDAPGGVPERVPATAARAGAESAPALAAVATNAQTTSPHNGPLPLPASLLQTTSLQRLKLHNWTLHAEEFESLGSLPRLESLFVGKLKLERPPRVCLAGLRSLETDYLISGVKHLVAAAPRLASLSCEATDELLQILPKMVGLRSLGLWGYCGAVSEGALAALAAVPHLEKFRAEHLQPLTNRQLVALAAAHPSLRSLDLSYCAAVTDLGVVLALPHSAALTAARFLRCSGITAVAVAGLAGLPSMKQIKVLHCAKVQPGEIDELLAQPRRQAVSVKFEAAAAGDDDMRITD